MVEPWLRSAYCPLHVGKQCYIKCDTTALQNGRCPEFGTFELLNRVSERHHMFLVFVYHRFCLSYCPTLYACVFYIAMLYQIIRPDNLQATTSNTTILLSTGRAFRIQWWEYEETVHPALESAVSSPYIDWKSVPSDRLPGSTHIEDHPESQSNLHPYAQIKVHENVVTR